MNGTAGARALNETTLHDHAARAAVPRYDRNALAPGVVHIGVGGFHRSHQALYFDKLAERGVLRWGITGVNLRHRTVQDALAPQQGLYTLVERGDGQGRARVIGSLRRQLFGPEQREAVTATLADARTRVVTLTVTGAGYDDASAGGGLTAADLLVDGLARRRSAGLPPFTVLSCDNIPDNGAKARAAVVGAAGQRDEVLATWIDRYVSFPGSMVDRITPQTSAEDRRAIAEEFGIADRWPVIAEPFTQWVVEDDFCNERPPLHRVGVDFVADVAPYRLAKTRMLNASHSALGYLGWLAGYRRTDEAMADPVIRDYLSRLMADEIAPLLPPISGLDLTAYRQTLLIRFANSDIRDPLTRLCARGSTKMPAYLLPSLIDARRRGQPHELLVLAVAAWFRYLRGHDCAGRPFGVADAHGERLGELARAGGDDPRALLSERAVFGDLGDDEGLVRSLHAALERLARLGPLAAATQTARADELEVAA